MRRTEEEGLLLRRLKLLFGGNGKDGWWGVAMF